MVEFVELDDKGRGEIGGAGSGPVLPESGVVGDEPGPHRHRAGVVAGDVEWVDLGAHFDRHPSVRQLVRVANHLERIRDSQGRGAVGPGPPANVQFFEGPA